MKAYSSIITFSWKGQRIVFVPNRNFWFLISGVFAWLIWFIFLLYQEGQVIDSELQLNLLSGSNQGTFTDEEVSKMTPKVLVALTVFVNFILRRLINYFLKVNNVLLLAESKITAFQNRPLALTIAGRTVSFQPNNKLWYGIGLAFALAISTVFYLHYNNQAMQERLTAMEQETQRFDQWFESQSYKQDVLGYFIDYFNEYDKNQKSIQQNYREAFQIQKHLLVTQHLIKNKVSRIDQLDDESLLVMNGKIAALFKELVIDKQRMEPHVYDYFTDTVDLNKVKTALMEQVKFHVPASIKLAQSALETAYGRRVVNNNYFGIKDKTKQSSYMETTEYYTAKEVAYNKHKILSKKKVRKNGKVLYKCKVRDSFMDYHTPWQSFRAHSVYLANNKRYAPLFTNGKDYRAWADRIGSTKYGGVGYATSPIYGNLLKKIIARYNLDLLDY